MKIAHLVYSDVGGAYRAAERISDAINTLGEESNVFVIDKNFQDSCIPLLQNRREIIIYKIKRRLGYIKKLFKWGISDLYFAECGYNVLNNSEVESSDVVHIHWVGFDMLSEKQIKLLVEKKTVVWTLHDMWPFTGGCYYSGNCLQYLEGCTNCKKANSVRMQRKVLATFEFKKKLFANTIGVVGCSKWIANEAVKSHCMTKKNVIVIPNPINAEQFKYTPSNIREKYGIDRQTKIIVFGAISSDKDERKGLKKLIEALKLIEETNFCCIIFGNTSQYSFDLNCRMIFLGKIRDECELAQIYSVADVVVVPSLQENLSNTVVESLSCGTPVIAFDIGGMPDMIKNGVNGYLVTPFETSSMAKRIEDVFRNPFDRNGIAILAKKQFDSKKIAEQYVKFYKKCMDQCFEGDEKSEN